MGMCFELEMMYGQKNSISEMKYDQQKHWVTYSSVLGRGNHQESKYNGVYVNSSENETDGRKNYE